VISDLKPYSAIKHSSVEWLGDVPERWKTRRLKQIFRRIVGGTTPSTADISYWDGDIIWITPTDISKHQYLTDSLRKITQAGFRACSTELVPPESIIITSRAPVGNIAIAEVELCTNQGL
jgi:type I restriction enzyme S subunit